MLVVTSAVMKNWYLVTIVLSSVAADAGSFQNLGFEEARINSLKRSPDLIFDYFGAVSDLLPGWQLFSETQPITTLGFNLSPIGKLSYASLLSSEPPLAPSMGSPIEGKYSLFFQVGGANPEAYQLVQRGDIPPDARFLTFKYVGLPFSASVDGVNLSPSIQNGGDPPEGRTAFLDVSRFAGQNVELRLTTSSGPFGPAGNHRLDAIAFVVPEPSAWLLLVWGVLGMVLYCFCRDSNKRVVRREYPLDGS